MYSNTVLVFFRIVRVCVQDTVLCGMDVPKGMSLLVPVHYLHNMKQVWGDPEVFRPERSVLIVKGRVTWKNGI